MMNFIRKLTGALLLSGALAASASAVPIAGEISFTGSYTVDNSDLSLATAFTSFSGVQVAANPTGDYAGLGGSAVNMTAFSFAPFPVGGVTPLWSLVATPTTSFDLLSISIQYVSQYTLVLMGHGWAHMDGKESAIGSWALTANTFGTTFSFSATNQVPDGGATALLLGAGLVCIGFVSRRFKAKA